MGTLTHTISLVCISQAEYDERLARADAYDAGPDPNLTDRSEDEPNLTFAFTIPAEMI